MITEVARIDVKPGLEAEFEAAMAKASAVFRRAKGFRSAKLHRSIEKPNRFRLMIQWETLENHTVDFRGSEDYKQWRELVAHSFDGAPEVEHHNLATEF